MSALLVAMSALSGSLCSQFFTVVSQLGSWCLPFSGLFPQTVHCCGPRFYLKHVRPFGCHVRPLRISVLSILHSCLLAWVGMSALLGSLCSHALNSLHLSPSFGSDVCPFRISVLSFRHICLPASVVMSALFESRCSRFITFVSQLGSWCPPFSNLCALDSLHLSPSLGRDVMQPFPGLSRLSAFKVFIYMRLPVSGDVRPYRISVLSTLFMRLPGGVVMFAGAAPKFQTFNGLNIKHWSIVYCLSPTFEGLRWHNLDFPGIYMYRIQTKLPHSWFLAVSLGTWRSRIWRMAKCSFQQELGARCLWTMHSPGVGVRPLYFGFFTDGHHMSSPLLPHFWTIKLLHELPECSCGFGQVLSPKTPRPRPTKHPRASSTVIDHSG